MNKPVQHNGFVGFEGNYLIVNIPQKRWKELFRLTHNRPPREGEIQHFARQWCEKLARKNGYRPEKLRGVKNLADR